MMFFDDDDDKIDNEMMMTWCEEHGHPNNALYLDKSKQLDQTSNNPSVSNDADDKSVSLYKRAQRKDLCKWVAERMLAANPDSPMKSAYLRMLNCCEFIHQSEDGKLTTNYCSERLCPICGAIRSAQIIESYASIIESWECEDGNDNTGCFLVTLTLPSCNAAELHDFVAKMSHRFTLCVRTVKRILGKKVEALRKIECTYNEDGTMFHPHIHAVVRGLDAANALRKQWKEKTIKAGERIKDKPQDVRKCKAGSIRELCKYLCKISCKGRFDPKALDAILCAFYGRRTLQSYGFKLPPCQAIDEDELMLDTGTRVTTNLGEEIIWRWQNKHGWLNHTTGELLTTYHRTPEFERWLKKLDAGIKANTG